MQRRFVRLLLEPSLFSGILTGFITIALVSISNWSSLLQHFFFYDYFFGPTGFITSIHGSTAGGGLNRLTTFTNESLSYNLLILFVAVMVGLTVYMVLQIFGRVANDASATWESLHAKTNDGFREISIRWLIRVAIALTWLAYCLIFSKLIVPFCLVAVQVGSQELWAPSGLLYISGGTILTFLSLHMHAVFMRLLMLRARVFGGNDAILTDEFRRKR